MPCFSAGKLNVATEQSAGTKGPPSCGLLRDPQRCGKYFYDAGAMAGACQWNPRSKRCELSKEGCLVLPALPPTASCGSKRLAFVHINRAAGSSVGLSLSGCPNATSRFYFKEQLGDAAPLPAASHVTARLFIAQWQQRTGTCTALGLDVSRCAAAWRAAVFSFAVVRNPFDRMVSIFHSLLERECTPARHTRVAPSRQCQLRRFPFVEESWRASHEGRVAAFRRWLADLDAAYPTSSSKNALFSSAAAVESRRDASQLAWVEDAEGAVAVTTVLKLEENLQHWWARLAHECLPGCALSLPHALKTTTRHEAATHAYYDEASQAIVRRQAWRDFQAFNYSDSVL